MNGKIESKSLFAREIDPCILLLLSFAGLKLILHLIVNATGGYGIFRDELYYLACSYRPAAGYVDHPPFSILILSAVRTVLGNSVFALRLLPALLGACSVFVAGLAARRLGGGKFAISLTSVSMIVAPIFLAMNAYYSMNAFDLLFWTIGGYLLIRILQKREPRLWLALGLVIGLGLLNKIGMLWFAFGVLCGILATRTRKELKTPWPYAAGFLALALFLPFVLWNIQNGFAHVEFIRGATALKYSGLDPLDFLSGQILLIHPLNLPVWILGLVFLFFHKDGKPFKILGIVWFCVLAILLINGHSKAEYLSPAYPMLLAAGAVYLEKILTRLKLPGLRWIFPVVILIGGCLFAPMVLPILPVESFIRYTQAIGRTPDSPEGKDMGELPQHYADRFGWEEMARTVSAVYESLPEEEKSGTVVYVNNYGEAGAMEYFGNRFPLPPVICPHNNYWLWSQKTLELKFDTIIVLDGDEEDLAETFTEVIPAGVFQCEYCMPYENNLPIYICRNPRGSVLEIWDSLKNYQ